MPNPKYEITDIAHTQYPFLHRIRALQDIGEKVKAGDLGGFVESESNLSTEDDASWIFDDAIAAGSAFVDQDACLYEKAVACDCAYASQQAEVSGEARIEDFAYIRGSVVRGHARVSAHGMILDSPDTGKAPALSENCVVYGTVMGDVQVKGDAVVLSEERIDNQTLDTLVISGQSRSVIRDPSRDELRPRQQQKAQIGLGDKERSVLFSVVTVTAGSEEAKFLVGGIPREYDDLEDWDVYDKSLIDIGEETEVQVHAEAYLYGSGETDQAKPDDIAQLTKLMEADERFLADVCDHIEDVDFRFTWSPEEVFGMGME